MPTHGQPHPHPNQAFTPKRIVPVIFPGVDPWVEGSGLFNGFHQDLAVSIARHLESNLPDGYSANAVGSITLSQDLLEATGGDAGHYRPDVAVFSTPGTSAVLDAPRRTLEGAVRGVYSHDDLVDGVALFSHDRLITWIEVLSPWNKTLDGVQAFSAKRRNVIASGVHVVTIDLIRGGRSTVAEPRADYSVSWHFRDERDPQVRPFGIRDAIPDLLIPLDQAAYQLELSAIYRDVWLGQNRGSKMTYDQAELRPKLGQSDRDWAQELVRRSVALRSRPGRA